MGRNPFVFAACLLALTACDDDTPLDPSPSPGSAWRIHNYAGTGVEGVGVIDQAPLETDLRWPQDIAFAPDSSLLVVDWGNHRVLAINRLTDRFGQVTGTFDGTPGEPCAPYPPVCETGAADAPLNHPTHVCFGPDGKMVLSAWHNAGVFRVDRASDAMVRVAGTGRSCYDGDEKAANTACVSFPSGAEYDREGRIVFTDQVNMIVRMIDEDGLIHTIAGTQPVWDGARYVVQAGFRGDGGPATEAKFRFGKPTTGGKLCVDATGNIYIADTENHAVRVLDTAGMIHRFAGRDPASAGFGGDGGPATAAQLREPRDVACDADGNVFIADTGNHVIRMVAPDGIISTVAGIPGVTGDGSDDGTLATETGLNLPYGIEIDPEGNLWIADTENHRVRVVYR